MCCKMSLTTHRKSLLLTLKSNTCINIIQRIACKIKNSFTALKYVAFLYNYIMVSIIYGVYYASVLIYLLYEASYVATGDISRDSHETFVLVDSTSSG